MTQWPIAVTHARRRSSPQPATSTRSAASPHTTVKDITERVGVTRTLFYHYFPDKDAVTSAVIDDYTQDYVEALANWNDERIEGDIDHALSTIVRLLRIGLFEDDTFHVALSSRENAALYLEFVNRVADETTRYIIDTTVRDYADLHDISDRAPVLRPSMSSYWV